MDKLDIFLRRAEGLTAALQWSLMCGRSGRAAGQFARDWCGRHSLRSA
jgi:predicted AAA+ superfamily ATPase